MKKNFRNKQETIKRCSCGAIMKKRIRTNYPFGKKSKSQKTEHYKCVKCGGKTIKSEEEKYGR